MQIMSGFEEKRFVVSSEQDLEEYICGVCLAVLNDPVVTQCCGQTYCKQCIKEWLKHNNTCPNDRKRFASKQLIRPSNAFKNLLNKLQIKCDFESNGCKAMIGLSELSVHQNSCLFNAKKKCKTCEQIMGFEHNCCLNLKNENKRKDEEMNELREEIKKLKVNETNDSLTIDRISKENKRLSEEIKGLKTQMNRLTNNSNERKLNVFFYTMSEEMSEFAVKLANEAIDINLYNYLIMDSYIERKLNAEYGIEFTCHLSNQLNGKRRYLQDVKQHYICFKLFTTYFEIFEK